MQISFGPATGLPTEPLTQDYTRISYNPSASEIVITGTGKHPYDRIQEPLLYSNATVDDEERLRLTWSDSDLAVLLTTLSIEDNSIGLIELNGGIPRILTGSGIKTPTDMQQSYGELYLLRSSDKYSLVIVSDDIPSPFKEPLFKLCINNPPGIFTHPITDSLSIVVATSFASRTLKQEEVIFKVKNF